MTGVTRRRDGFRNRPDERSKEAVAVCRSWWRLVGEESANNLHSRQLSPMSFSAPSQGTWRFSAMSPTRAALETLAMVRSSLKLNKATFG